MCKLKRKKNKEKRKLKLDGEKGWHDLKNKKKIKHGIKKKKK